MKKIALAVLAGMLSFTGISEETNSVPSQKLTERLDLFPRMYLNYTQRRLEDYLLVPMLDIQRKLSLRSTEKPWEYTSRKAWDAVGVGALDGVSGYLNAQGGLLPEWLQLMLAPYDTIRISSPLTDKGVPGFFGGSYDRFLLVPDILRRDPNLTFLYRPFVYCDLNLRVSHEAVDLVGTYRLGRHFRLVGAGKIDDLLSERSKSAYFGLVYHTKQSTPNGLEYSKAIIQLGVTQVFDPKEERKVGVSAVVRF